MQRVVLHFQASLHHEDAGAYQGALKEYEFA